jgi:hypothetical protein
MLQKELVCSLSHSDRIPADTLEPLEVLWRKNSGYLPSPDEYSHGRVKTSRFKSLLFRLWPISAEPLSA